MREWDDLELLAECDRLCDYLLDCPATPDIVAAYRAGHGSMPAATEAPIDRLLLRLARGGRGRLRLADAYARLTRPETLLRRKVALALAVLESSRGTHGKMNAGPESRKMSGAKRRGWSALLGLGPSLVSVAGWTVLSMAVLGPVHLLSSIPWVRRG